MAEPATASLEPDATIRRFLTFHMEDRIYAVPADEVVEIIRVPAVARLPQSPRGLLGVANLRGTVLPVASLRALLGREDAAASTASRAIVLQGAAPVALAVDSIQALISVDTSRIETRRAKLAADDGEPLQGAFPTADGDIARLIDLRGLLASAFVQQPRPQGRVEGRIALEQVRTGAAEDRRGKLVTFEVGGQECGLELSAVQEVVAAPDHVAVVPHAETAVVGVMSYRDGLLPLLSLRGLLALNQGGASDGREKVVVAVIGGVLVGLVADRMRAIVPIDPDLLDPTPPMLAARTGGEARIEAIYRAEGGRRLISVLAPEQLFREDVMQRLGSEAPSAAPAEAAVGEEAQYVVFRLGDDEFGLPIDTVDEVARVPEQITRLPKTPKFIEGVVNLRGEVLPVIDQRRRFDMPSREPGEVRRLMVVRTDRHRAGLIVDSVSEVLRAAVTAVEPAPDLTGEATRLVYGVLNLQTAGRLILLLDPRELLSRAERGLLDAFDIAGATVA